MVERQFENKQAMIVDKNKRVSIIIPTYNRIGYFKEALESALNQTYADIEIIVCDNASTDDTHVFMTSQADKRIKYIRHEKPVSYIDNFNSWLNTSTGDFVCYLTDDDKFEPAFVEKCVEPLVNDESILLVKTGSFIMNEKSVIVGDYLPYKHSTTSGMQFILDRINPRYSEFSMLCGYMFRKSDFIKVDGVLVPGEPASHAADDYLWFRMALLGGNVKYINEKLWHYRAHSSNMAVVHSLSDFKIFSNTFTAKVIALFDKHAGEIDKNILDYVRNEYGQDLNRTRVLNEINRNRKSSYFKALKFLFVNKKIIAEYCGMKRVFLEMGLNLFLAGRTR